MGFSQDYRIDRIGRTGFSQDYRIDGIDGTGLSRDYRIDGIDGTGFSQDYRIDRTGFSQDYRIDRTGLSRDFRIDGMAQESDKTVHHASQGEGMKSEIDTLTGLIIGCAMEVHKTLGPGFLESVYEKALAIELGLQGLAYERQLPIHAQYKGHSVGDFVADLLVEKKVLVELKASQALHDRHGIQLVNYLTATGIDDGLLLNFGADSLQFKRKRRTYTPPHSPSPQSRQSCQSCQSCNPG